MRSSQSSQVGIALGAPAFALFFARTATVVLFSVSQVH
jgi:hypothetical protein